MPKKATRRGKPILSEHDKQAVRAFKQDLEDKAAENCAALAGPHKDFRKVVSFEPMTRDTWEKIYRMFTPAAAIVAGLNFVDHRYGAGRIDEDTRCVWTRQKRRVVISCKGGAITATLSKFEDPECPARSQ